jgi:hypothetical protein
LFFFLVVSKLKGVVEEDVRLPLVKVWIDDLQVFLGQAPSGVVHVDPEDALQHLDHLLFVLVPHSGAAINARNLVGRPHLKKVMRVNET